MSTAESQTPQQGAPTGAITYAQFLDWADEDTLAEWVDGEVVMTSPANARHQLVAFFLGRIIARFVELHRLGLVLPAPFQMHLPAVSSGREPDVLFIATSHLGRLQPPERPTHVEGPADLVIEVISPESIERDRARKLDEYARGGVPEYRIVDPDQRRADFYRLTGVPGTYRAVTSDAQGVYHTSALPGFWLRVDWLWQDSLPDVDQVVEEIATAAATQGQARRASDAYVREFLGELRRLGKLPDQGG
jgi:Uma2 family endonuclease